MDILIFSLVKRTLTTLIKIYDGFCFMIGFPYELITLVKRSQGIESNCCCFRTGVISFTYFACIDHLEETLKAVGPFYLVSMPGEVKDPTQGVNV